jgi:hypothetical protein
MRGMSDAARGVHAQADPPGGAPVAASAALPPTTLLLVFAVLLLQLGFIFSYVAAFHNPKPHRIPLAIVAPSDIAPRVVDELDAIPGHVANARAVATEAQARQQIRTGTISAAIIVNTTGTTDQLL